LQVKAGESYTCERMIAGAATRSSLTQARIRSRHALREHRPTEPKHPSQTLYWSQIREVRGNDGESTHPPRSPQLVRTESGHGAPRSEHRCGFPGLLPSARTDPGADRGASPRRHGAGVPRYGNPLSPYVCGARQTSRMAGSFVTHRDDSQVSRYPQSLTPMWMTARRGVRSLSAQMSRGTQRGASVTMPPAQNEARPAGPPKLGEYSPRRQAIKVRTR
jgi:hypothetical protein